MILRLQLQGGNLETVNVQDPWLHLRWSLGIHLLPNGDAVLDNGVANADSAGGIYIKHLEADGEVLCSGNHYIPPRAILPIRRSPVSGFARANTKHLPAERNAWNAWGTNRAAAVKNQIALGKAAPSLGFFFDRMGPWFPNFSGQPQPGATSGQGIEFLPGWERNSEYRLLLADLTMHRAALAYTDVETGQPLTHIRQPRYALSRGYGKETQLAEFCAPYSLDQYDDRRRPRNCNTGTCAYEDVISGMNRYNGCLPEDDQHLIRLYRHALAGWQIWGDPLCKFYLDKIAADTSLVWGAMPTTLKAKGAGWAGRASGWACHLLKAVGHSDGAALDRSLYGVRVKDGLHQRCAWSPTFSWGFAPDPWEDKTWDGQKWVAKQPYALRSENVAQSIEAAIVGHACGEPTQTALSLTQYGNPSHFMLVTDSGCSLDHKAGVERESFNVWACWGKGLAVAGRSARARLKSNARKMRLPDDPKPYLTDDALLDGMVKNPHTLQLAPAIKALEET